MFHVEQSAAGFAVTYRDARVSSIYNTRRGAHAALQRMLRCRVIERMPASLDEHELDEALKAHADALLSSARGQRVSRGLDDLPVVDAEFENVLDVIAAGNLTAARCGWPAEIRDELRAVALLAPDVEAARAVYW